MKKDNKTRQDRLDDGQFYDGFEFKGKKHRPLTAAGMKFLQRIGSALFTNDFTDQTEMDLVIQFLYATSASPAELAKAPLEWETLQYEFGDEYTIKDFADPSLIENIMRDLKNQAAATVDVKDSGEKK